MTTATRRSRWMAALTWVALGAGTIAAWATKARCLLTEGRWTAGEEYLGYCYTDVYPLWWVERLNEGAVPYLDHPVEYPVLTGAWMGLADFIGRQFGPPVDARPFLHATMVMGAAFLVGTFLVLRRMGVSHGRLVLFALAPTLIAYAFINWDTLPVLLATAAIWLHRTDRDAEAGVAIGLGAAAKLYPVLLLPVFVVARLRQGRWRAGAATAATAAAAWLVLNLPIALAAPRGWWRFFELSRTRPADHDSLYRILEVEVLPFAYRVLGVADVPAEIRFDVSLLNVITGAAFVIAAAAIIVVGVRRRDAADLWELSLPLLIAFLLTSKVYSPQFSLWLLPLLILIVRRPAPLIAFFIADTAVFLTRFPWLGGRLDPPLSPAPRFGVFATAIAVRAAVLLWIAWTVTRTRTGPEHGSTAEEPERVAYPSPEVTS